MPFRRINRKNIFAALPMPYESLSPAPQRHCMGQDPIEAQGSKPGARELRIAPAALASAAWRRPNEQCRALACAHSTRAGLHPPLESPSDQSGQRQRGNTSSERSSCHCRPEKVNFVPAIIGNSGQLNVAHHADDLEFLVLHRTARIFQSGFCSEISFWQWPRCRPPRAPHW